MAQTVKRLPAMLETWVQSLGWGEPLEKGMAIHSIMDRGAWRATVHRVAKSWTQLSDFTLSHTHTHTHTCTPQQNHSQFSCAFCFALENISYLLKLFFFSYCSLAANVITSDFFICFLISLLIKNLGVFSLDGNLGG